MKSAVTETLSIVTVIIKETKEHAKKIFDNFDECKFFIGKSKGEDGQVVILTYREDRTTRVNARNARNIILPF